MIVHHDLPENNWGETFKTVLEAPESYLKIPMVFYSGLGRSFNQQIFPDNSVHIGISSLAFHFLPRPFCAFDHIFVSSSSDLALKSQASKTAHNYLVNLLTLRHKELVPSGRLLIVFPTETIGNLFPSIILQTVNENMHAKGVINEEEKRNVTIPVYARNDEELRRTLEEVGNLYRVIEWKKADDESRPTEENREELYESLKVLAVSHLEAILKKVVKREVGPVVEEYKKEVEKVLGEIPFTSFPTFHLVVLEKILN
ncbi:unnamed protein product [Blepharisma stoltei]|uniref:Uncharacterized protein n=1 Tax=Blepharisma stoltei TaxID=1481888 RepID=A0AAU9JGG5_9CILI|nr:unnamed protein product [Blepharisma stoltei]